MRGRLRTALEAWTWRRWVRKLNRQQFRVWWRMWCNRNLNRL